MRSLPHPTGLAIGPGWPWPVVSGAAAVAALLLAWLALDLGGLGGLLFPIGFAAICVVAVCTVHSDQLYVPSVQPPFVATVAVVGAALLTGRTTSTTTFLLSVLAPLAALFWWLLVVSLACVVLGLVRSGRLPGRLPGSAAWSWRRDGR